MLKNCAYCSKEFEAKNDRQIFCSRSHQSAAQQGKTFSGFLPDRSQQPNNNQQLLTNNPQQPKERINKSGYNSFEQYIIEDLKTKVTELKTKVSDLQTKNETLLEQKTDLEKQAEQTKRQLDEKPTGLGAIMQNPDVSRQLAEVGIPVLVGIADKLVGWVTEQRNAPKQLGEGQSAAQPHPVYAWLVAQTPDIQAQFVLLLEGLEASKRTKEYLESWNRNFMSIIKHARNNR